ncbi:MAG: adenosylcobinamide-GDP ribazoletransferase [Actinobacteria bacterium]|nr:adenosylcobinamide-GDP ribazoletransferase [Actinomycetota bacterium]MCB9412221.1 adenosylcobinamide-GDP ribazoletransferase [Actinomycetota bacterium]
MTVSPPSAAGTRLGDGLRLAIGTFTSIPVPPPDRVDSTAWRVALATAPGWGGLLGVLLGSLAAAVWWLADLTGNRSNLAAILLGGVVFAGYALLTRGLHLDGLADTADGFASGRRGAAALAVMRDPNLGALGGVTLIVVAGLDTVALAALFATAGVVESAILLASVLLLARAPLAWLTRKGVPAADGGLGRSAIGALGPRSAAAVGVGWAMVAVVAMAVVGVPVWVAAGVAAATGVIVLGLERAAVRRFGAINGDVLGASVELATCWLLLSLALLS